MKYPLYHSCVLVIWGCYFLVKQNGYFTVEASFIIPIFVYLICVLIYLTYYMHDQMLLLEKTYYEAAYDKRENWDEGFIIMDSIVLNDNKLLTLHKLTVEYDYRLSMPIIKQLLMQGQKKGKEEYWFHKVNIAEEFRVYQEGKRGLDGLSSTGE